jgi:hypothetical protein
MSVALKELLIYFVSFMNSIWMNKWCVNCMHMLIKSHHQSSWLDKNYEIVDQQSVHYAIIFSIVKFIETLKSLYYILEFLL